MEKYGKTRQASDDNVIKRIRPVFWIINVSHSECVIFVAF